MFQGLPGERGLAGPEGKPVSKGMAERCRLGLGEVLWSHTSQHQHQQEHLCLIHLLLPPNPMQGLQSFRVPFPIPTPPKCPGWVPHIGNGEHPWRASRAVWRWWVSPCPLTLMWLFAGLARLSWCAGTPGRCLCVPHVPLPHDLSTRLGAPGCEYLVKPWGSRC